MSLEKIKTRTQTRTRFLKIGKNSDFSKNSIFKKFKTRTLTLTRFFKNSKNSNFLLIRKFTKNIDSSYARTDFLVSWKTYTRTQTNFFEVQKTRTRTRTRFWKFPKNSNFWLTQFSVIWKKLELFKKLAKSFFDSLNRFLNRDRAVGIFTVGNGGLRNFSSIWR